MANNNLDKAKEGFKLIKDAAKGAVEQIDTDDIKKRASKIGGAIADEAGKVKDAAIKTKDDIQEKITELDRMLESSITEYNDIFTLMNDKGLSLYIERTRAVDIITHTEALVNSIANHPKSFDSDFNEIEVNKKAFMDTCSFADKELKAARHAATGAGAGLAAGTSVVFMAPTAAMWVATTFGTASTGAAISTLSGAAATNAALAWLGGGTLAAGGGGISGGAALLAMAGPIGWSIAGATLLTSIVLFASKRTKINKEKNEEIESVKNNIEKIKKMDSKIENILLETVNIKENLSKQYDGCIYLSGKDYSEMGESDKLALGSLVNMAKSLSLMFKKTVEEE